MLSYFCVSNTGRQFLYIPFNLFGYDSLRSKDLNLYWDPEFLAKLTLLFKEGKIKRERLEEKGWEIYEIDIPDRKVMKFKNLCSKTKNNRKILRFSESIFSYAENEFNNMQDLEDLAGDERGFSGDLEDEDYEDDIGDEYEDYLDSWWLRGEDPPFYRAGNQ